MMGRIFHHLSVFLALLLVSGRLFAGAVDTTIVTGQRAVLLRGNQLEVFTDLTNQLPYTKIRTITAFSPPVHTVPNLGVSRATFWIKFTLFNETNLNHLMINIRNSHLNQVRLYYSLDDTDSYTYVNSGNLIPVSRHPYSNQNNLFDVPIPAYSVRTFYLCISSSGQIVVPVFVGTASHVVEETTGDDLSFGIYLGIILIMLFYNLFVYFSVRDKNYLYYIGFIFFIGFSQFCLHGYGYRFFWSTLPFITLQSINWSVAFSGIATILFSRIFLHTEERTPVFDKVLVGFIILYSAIALLTLVGLYNVAYILSDIIAFLCSFALWGIATKYTLEGYRPAKFFLVAWSFFLLSVILHVIKDFGGIPYTFFSNNIMLIGSSIEIALLSFALADTINVYREEKEQSQARALEVSKEKEQFVKEQNAILESRINERTSKLQQLNLELNTALNHLKETQSQLVDAEKMASLGQLTAGIAHEINNPINFVMSNIKPLQLDILEIKRLLKLYEEIDQGNLKDKLLEIDHFRQRIEFGYIMQEIDTLLKGIEEGASRTADIIKGLRIFSRVNETELKEADVQEGIDTTLMLLTNLIPPNLEVVRHYEKIPKIVCYPGKLNQVFMNILTNAVQAIKSKPDHEHETITLTTSRKKQHVIISVADTGPGIPGAIIEKIFDPFFTTKEVGEGTGLGLSIAYGIIEKHRGKIEVRSAEGKGTEFVITLPIHQPIVVKNPLPEGSPDVGS